jgi:aminoglycoside/choline kinase family phosphotransferase
MWRPGITNLDPKTDVRFREMTAWLTQFTEFADVTPTPASTDASFRRYFRVQGERSCIVMDAPPPEEDCQPFVQIAGFLESMGLNSPHVIAADLQKGFLLLTDLGSVQFLYELREQPDRVDALYFDALTALLTMQRKGTDFQASLPSYDDKLLRFELSIFHDWLCEQQLGIRFSNEDEAAWKNCCDVLVESALQQEVVFVHRDFHSRNLMLSEKNNPGILDFQDAVEGPLTYDLVSLLKDCYVKWPTEKVEQWALSFYARLPDHVRGNYDARQFMRLFDLMGVQRHLKAAGIFARLLQRDGKPGYMRDVPRTLSYIVDVAPRYSELAFLAELMATRVLPALEVAD